MTNCDVFAPLDPVSLRRQKAEKGVKIMGLFFQRPVDGGAENITMGWFRFSSEPFIVAVVSPAWILYDG